MRSPVKICGLATSKAVEAAHAGGATHVGFIFFEKSPRHIDLEQARALSAHGGTSKRVAVTVNASDQQLDGIVEALQPHMLQLHGAECPARVEAVKSRYGLPVIKAIAVRSADDIAVIADYDRIADLILLDAKPPKGSDLPGGNGVSFDWSLVRTVQTRCPVLLSGGIDLSNVDEALELVDDDANSIIGLDVSSGVESAPGAKDLEKIKSFLARCDRVGESAAP